MSLLEIRDLQVDRGGVRALRGVSLRVEAEEIVALLGANGAGKTTTLRAVSGLSPARSGSVRLGGELLTGESAAAIVDRRIAHVPEGSRIWPDMTVLENLRLGAWSLGTRRRPEIIGERLDRVFRLLPRLKERTGQRAGTLSGGERQMAAIGRALMAAPRLLLMDEPSLGLAPRVVDAVFETIAAIRQEGVAVLLVEQNLNRALQLAGRGYVLENGRITREGAASELLEDAEVRRAYLGKWAAVARPPG